MTCPFGADALRKTGDAACGGGTFATARKLVDTGANVVLAVGTDVSRLDDLAYITGQALYERLSFSPSTRAWSRWASSPSSPPGTS